MHTLENITKTVQGIVSNDVYAVGGCVRDTLLNITPKDFDFCTPLSPDVVEDKVRKAGRRPYLVGKKFGTVGFKVNVNQSWQYVEVTTYRGEKYNSGSRKPEVSFVDNLDDDLSRRDFTINAIAYQDNKYYDPYGGRLDILERKIKSVGKAKDRFKDDPLRMLRMARFSSQLNFNVDPNLIGVTRQMGVKILDVSKERWVQEIDKLLLSKQPQKGIDILKQSYLLELVLPEVNILPFNLNVTQQSDINFAWANLLKNIGEPYSDNTRRTKLISYELTQGICSRLKFSNDRTKKVLEYINSN